MSAVILPFQRTEKPANTFRQPEPPALHATLLDAINQALIEDYAAWPWVVIDEATRAAADALHTGGNYLDALDAAERVIACAHQPAGQAASERLRALLVRRTGRQQAFFNMAARIIGDRLQGKPVSELHAALVRARRIIEGGGTINTALYCAMGEEWQG